MLRYMATHDVIYDVQPAGRPVTMPFEHYLDYHITPQMAYFFDMDIMDIVRHEYDYENEFADLKWSPL